MSIGASRARASVVNAETYRVIIGRLWHRAAALSAAPAQRGIGAPNDGVRLWPVARDLRRYVQPFSSSLTFITVAGLGIL